MDYRLSVVEPFRNYSRGDHITDPAEVEAILRSEHHGHVVQRFPQAGHADGTFYMTDEELATQSEAKAEAATAPSAPAFATPADARGE